MKRYLLFIVLVFLLIIPAQAQSTPLQVIATTTVIADVAQNVGGDLVAVASLVPVDTDIHAFQPLPQDVARVADADLILVNGAGLEEFLGGLVENAAEVELVVVSNGVEVLGFSDGHGHEEGEEDHAEDEADHEGEHMGGEHLGVLGVDAACEAEAHEVEAHEEEADHAEEDHEHGACDPHFWTDPNNVSIWVGNIAEAFAAADPANAEIYRTNATAYQAELAALDAEIQAQIAELPEENRVIVTNHEFLGYFAHHYGFEVVGTVIPSVSTVAEPSPQEVAALIEIIQAEGVQAIFAEVSDPGRLAEIVAADAGDVQVVTLYSDALSAADGPAATYLDYLRYNAGAIIDALR